MVLALFDHLTVAHNPIMLFSVNHDIPATCERHSMKNSSDMVSRWRHRVGLRDIVRF
jgi:hypothetical protein